MIPVKSSDCVESGVGYRHTSARICLEIAGQSPKEARGIMGFGDAGSLFCVGVFGFKW